MAINSSGAIYFLLITAVFLLFIVVIPINPKIALAQGSQNQTSVKIQIGGGNNTIQYYAFTPPKVEINRGQSVTWYSPTKGMGELHTVTFSLDPSLNFKDILPFKISDKNNLKLYEKYNLGQPQLIETQNGSTLIVSLNKPVWNPSVLKSQNNNDIQYLNGTDIQYTVDGTERGINSGIILPSPPPLKINSSNKISKTTDSQQLGPLFNPVHTFTLTFNNPGVYNYYCTFHPWMNGQIIVKK